MASIKENELKELFSSCSWDERLALAIFLINWCIREKQYEARLKIRNSSGDCMHWFEFPQINNKENN